VNDVKQVSIMRVGLSLPCPVPVLPGTPDTMDADGEAIPLEQRTEKCGVDGWWFIGGQPCCDIHLKQACELLAIDWQGVIDEGTDGRGLNETEQKPWGERHRYPQDQIVTPKEESSAATD
jgi:hypothetical protein